MRCRIGNRSEEHTSELQSLRHLVYRLLLRSEEHTSELQSLRHLVCRLLLEKRHSGDARERATVVPPFAADVDRQSPHRTRARSAASVLMLTGIIYVYNHAGTFFFFNIRATPASPHLSLTPSPPI